MERLRVETLAFPEADLLAWRRGDYALLDQLPPSSFIRRILDERIRNRPPGRRFFGEAFVAVHVSHRAGWYGSFKWLTSWPPAGRSPYAAEYRRALSEAFPHVTALQDDALALCPHLAGKRPVPPDLWLCVNGEHRFIEVKLPGDSIRPTQIAGLAAIATCLSNKDQAVSVWVYNLYPSTERPRPIPSRVHTEFQRFCHACRRPSIA